LQAAVARLRLKPADETLAAIAEVLRHWRWASHDIRAAVAPTIPHHCADAFMCGCARLAREHGVALHSHVGESKVQALAGMKLYGKTLLAHMDDLGLVGPDFTAAHAIWLDDDDLRRVAAKGGSLAHNPGSNMRLGNGLFRLRRALDLGVNVGLGTDGANCSDNQNMYEAMRYASMVSKVQTPDPRSWAGVEEVYRAATEGSARALGFRDIGAIAPGMKADIVFLDLSAITWIPHNWSVNQLVHAEDGTSVRHVMVGGRFLVRDGRLLTLDVAKLAVEAEAARERLEALNAEWKGPLRAAGAGGRLLLPALARGPTTSADTCATLRAEPGRGRATRSPVPGPRAGLPRRRASPRLRPRSGRAAGGDTGIACVRRRGGRNRLLQRVSDTAASQGRRDSMSRPSSSVPSRWPM
jgi:guanine deaminase